MFLMDLLPKELLAFMLPFAALFSLASLGVCTGAGGGGDFSTGKADGERDSTSDGTCPAARLSNLPPSSESSQVVESAGE